MLRVFIAIGQTPFDPTSGAAQATLHLAETLARGGCDVRSLATSGTEGRFVGQLPSGDFTTSGVRHRILEVSAARKHSWHHLVGKEYDAFFDRMLADFKPEIVFTFGDEFPDRARRARARAKGSKVVFCLHNARYLPRQPADVDVFLAPSGYLADLYRGGWGGDAAVVSLPTPIMAERVIAAAHDPVFVTFINPQPAKGLWFMVRFAEQLGRQHPEIPLRIIEGRATAADFLNAARAAGIDLTRFPNLYFSPGVADVREIWSTTRVLLAPSVWNEPAGRVAVEAMLNGAVPIVSDRGGLPEQVGAAGRVLPLPDHLMPDSGRPPAAGEIAPWLHAVAELCLDDAHFACASEAGRVEARRFVPPVSTARYLDFLAGIRDS